MNSSCSVVLARAEAAATRVRKGTAKLAPTCVEDAEARRWREVAVVLLALAAVVRVPAVRVALVLVAPVLMAPARKCVDRSPMVAISTRKLPN
jgi:hypothetical protein